MTKTKNKNTQATPALDASENAQATPASDASEQGANATLPLAQRIALLVCIVGVAASVALSVVALGAQNAPLDARPDTPAPVQQQAQTSGEDASQDKVAKDGAEEVHEHAWIADYGTIHHDAETTQRWVPATYKSVTENHTVCNDCQARIDGAAQRHLDETGHGGYTTDVPITDEVVDVAGHFETVVIKQAWDEEVVTGYHCLTCAETKDATE